MCMGMTLPQYRYRYIVSKTKIQHQFMWIFRASKSHGVLINIRVLVNLRTLNPHANFESEYIPFRLEYPQLLNHQAPLTLTAQLSALQRSLSLSTVVNIIPFRLTPGSGKIILSPENHKTLNLYQNLNCQEAARGKELLPYPFGNKLDICLR